MRIVPELATLSRRGAAPKQCDNVAEPIEFQSVLIGRPPCYSAPPPAFPAARASKVFAHERAKTSTAHVADDLNRRFRIEDVYPRVDGGRFPVKRIAGETVEVWADVFRDGHDVASAALVWRLERDSEWRHVPMRHFGNDRWAGSFIPAEIGRYVFAIAAWTDVVATWAHEVKVKLAAGQDVPLEAKEGRQLMAALPPRDEASTAIIARACDAFDQTGDVAVLLADDVIGAAAEAQERADLTTSGLFPLLIERPIARAGAWYEIMPRSQSPVPGRHGTFDDCIARLPEIAALGFDVVYLLPIHPIGRTNRKGRNNSLAAGPDDPGSPYAIGAAEGGHDGVHPELGTLDDFRRLVAAARELGMEVALDFAIQCSPDHPWVREHPEWFKKRPDG